MSSLVSTNNIYKYNKFRLPLIEKMNLYKNGKIRRIYLDYNKTEKPLILKLPDNMKIPYSMNIYEKEVVDKEGNSHSTINKYLTINFNNSIEKHQICKKIFKKFDKHILKMIKENVFGLFKNTPSITDIYNTNFNGLLNYARDKETKEIIDNYTGIRINITENTKVIDTDKNEYNIDEYLKEGTLGCPIISINFIYGSGLKYGVSIDLLYFIIKKPEKEISNCNNMFNTYSDSD
jgi:hypothetical protein